MSWTGDDGIAHLGWLAEFVMRTPPPLAPHAPGQVTYLVLDDFGRLGRAWRETFENATDRETLIRNLVEGEFNNPIRIVAFNSAEGWCRDSTVDIADELRRRYTEFGEVPESVLQFMQAEVVGPPRALKLERPRRPLEIALPLSTAAMVGSTKGTTSAQVQQLPCPMDPFRRAFSREPMLLRPDNAPLEPTATWPIEAGEGTEGISLDVPSTIPRA